MFTRIFSRVWYAFCVLCFIFGIFLAMQPNAHAQGAGTPEINPWVQHTEFDWAGILFLHKTGETDEDGDPLRVQKSSWFTTLAGCNKYLEEMVNTKPDYLTLDASFCFPIKKQPGQKRPEAQGVL